jgi:hypothetical protein
MDGGIGGGVNARRVLRDTTPAFPVGLPLSLRIGGIFFILPQKKMYKQRKINNIFLGFFLFGFFSGGVAHHVRSTKFAVGQAEAGSTGPTGPTETRQAYTKVLTELMRISERTSHASPFAQLPFANVTFGGGGFRTISYIAQMHVLQEMGLLDHTTSFSGASLGAFWALVALIPNTDIQNGDRLTDAMLLLAIEYAHRAHVGWFDSFGTCGWRFREALELLPDNIPDYVNGRLYVSITRTRPLRNVVISSYESREDVINAIIASMSIPFWTGQGGCFDFRGDPSLDGGFTDNLPNSNKNGVFAVTPPSMRHWTNVAHVFAPPGTLRAWWMGWDRTLESATEMMVSEFQHGADCCIKRLAGK